MFQNEFTHLIDGVNAVEVAVTLGHPPSKQPMAAENEAFRSRVVLDCPSDQERQVEPGTPPGEITPNESVVELTCINTPVEQVSNSKIGYCLMAAACLPFAQSRIGE
jgi:hypothetical protein